MKTNSLILESHKADAIPAEVQRLVKSQAFQKALLKNCGGKAPHQDKLSYWEHCMTDDPVQGVIHLTVTEQG